MSQNDKRKIVPSGGFFDELVMRAKLVFRLMGDRRVNLFTKALPVAGLTYFIWPIDIPGPLDDVAVLGLAVYLFVELCPPEVVEEHLRNLRSVIPAEFRDPPAQDENVIDGDFQEVHQQEAEQEVKKE
jgi:hypothetical protein